MSEPTQEQLDAIAKIIAELEPVLEQAREAVKNNG